MELRASLPSAVTLLGAFFLLLMGPLSGCVTPSAVRTPTATVPDVPRDIVGPTDVFEVRVHLEESLSGTFRVDGNGTISYPLLGELEVAGLTATGISELIRERLADGYLREPHVSVFVQETNSRKITVIGEVKKPGRYVYKDDMTVVDAIAESGGTTDRAALNFVVVTRRTDGRETSFDVPFKDITLGRSDDFSLVPGDVVVVAESAVR